MPITSRATYLGGDIFESIDLIIIITQCRMCTMMDGVPVVVRHSESTAYVEIIIIKKGRCTLPIMDRAGTAFHSSQNVINDEVTRIMPGMNTVVK